MGVSGPEAVNTKVDPALVIGPGRIVSVHDGDSLRVSLPMWAMIPGSSVAGWVEDVRVAHCNAPELLTDAGKAAAKAVAAWAGQQSTVTLLVWGREKYGRLLADLRTESGELLSAFVLALEGTKPMTVLDAMVRP